jgi:general secretion pathway protein D
MVTTTSNSDFWKLLEQSVRSILNSSLQQSLSVAAKQSRLELIKQEQDLRAKQMEAASKAGAAAPALANSMARFGSDQPSTSASLLPDDVIVNPVAGTITVNGTEKQQQLVQDYLTKVESGAQRQVLIEATIVEVQLSDAYQGGIDWSRLQTTGDIAGFTISQVLTGGFSGAAALAGAAAGNAITVGLANNTRLGNIAASVKLLQEFGNTRVLSSPKLMVLNNQTALLKAVDNLVYFDIQAQTSTSATGPSLTTFTTTAKSVAVGLVMGVTPQINADGRVLLTVRPTVSRQLTPVQDPNPSLCDANRQNCIANLVPQIQVREMESVLEVGNGQTVVLGGLMQDNVQRNRQQLPGADKLDASGEALRFRDERVTKSELVVFLRPTVVKNPSLESDELKFFQRFLPQTENPPSAKSSAAQ